MDDSGSHDAYNDLEERVKAVPIEATKSAFETLTELLEESNAMVQRATATEEVIKDARVVSSLTVSFHESTKCINVSESNFDPEIFAGAIVNLVRNPESHEPDWTALTKKCAPIFRYAPGFTYINVFEGEQTSTQEAKVVERKERQARKPLEQRKEPEKVKTITSTDEGASVVDKIGTLLIKCFRQNQKKPVCFFQFVFDPNSFSKTVENIFHLSFLARDGLVEISLNNQKLPTLTPINAEPTSNSNNSQKRKIQALPSITKAQWKEIIREFNITKAVIP